MSGTVNEGSETTLGEIYWDAYASSDPAYIEHIPFATLGTDQRKAIEAGACAVAAHVLDTVGDEILAAVEPKPAERYALVEQMGHRATVATIRETTFCGKQMIEATDLKGGGTSLIAPDSIYEITWITEADALARTRPWTAVALPAADDDDDPEVAENGGVWGFTEADL